MRLIITRPEEDALPLKAKLESMGHEALLLPLLRIVPVSDAKVIEKPYQAICVTSANALRSVKPLPWMQQLPILTVGPQSLNEAKQAGFAKASAHGGNVHLLAQHVAKSLDPAAGLILYLAGDQVSADLHGLLTARGFSVDKIVVYTAEPETPADLSTALRSADGVLLYSPRTARLFASAVAGAGLDQDMAQVICYCLSPNVALALPISWTCKVAKHADEQGMLAMLDRSSQSR